MKALQLTIALIALLYKNATWASEAQCPVLGHEELQNYDSEQYKQHIEAGCFTKQELEQRVLRINLYAELQSELISNGGEFKKIEVHELSPNNFGLIANEAVSEGETLMFIPDSQAITVSDENVLSESFKELQEKDEIMKTEIE